jgi:hypothetical protein
MATTVRATAAIRVDLEQSRSEILPADAAALVAHVESQAACDVAVHLARYFARAG